jgi:predicted nucleotidyltransferase
MKPYEAPEIQEKLALIKEAVLRVVPDTEAIYLFGSYVHGIPHKHSDLDIFVVVPECGTNEIGLRGMISRSVYKMIKNSINVDILLNYSKHFQKNINCPTMDRVAVTTGVKIYG